ncbi:MAG: PEP-CTERM sorting domain-containing protein [Planctomycetes bacterium]|nr:PEP-CTERM sorting domain-containing protein [Planctomycetota bacterium]
MTRSIQFALALSFVFSVQILTPSRSTCAGMVTLQNATATYSQQPPLSGNWFVSYAIDGDSTSGGLGSGWAVGRNNDIADDSALSETAVFETASDVGSGTGTELTFTLYQQLTVVSQHNIGRFRLSATTDSRSQFADGLQSGGDVTANWVVLTPLSATSTGGTTLTVQGDQSILASGPNPNTSIYSVTVTTNLTGITGFRLEVLEDPSLPKNGPGRSFTGNFVLTEFTVDAVTAVPEPSSLGLFALFSALGLLWFRGWHRCSAGVGAAHQ